MDKIRVDLAHSIHDSDTTGVFCAKLPEMGMKSDKVVEMADLYSSMGKECLKIFGRILKFRREIQYFWSEIHFIESSF